MQTIMTCICCTWLKGLLLRLNALLVCFRLEMLEVSGCTVLSCNVAWHAQAAHTNSQHGSWQAHAAESEDSNDSSKGFSSVQDAVAHAVAALDAVKAPAVPAAPALQVHYKPKRRFSQHMIVTCFDLHRVMQIA